MKKPILLIIIFVSALSSLFSEEYIFRNTYWGMTKNQVKRSETAEFLHEEENLITYNHTLLGEDVAIGYIFNSSNVLYQGMYLFLDYYEDDDFYIDLYFELRDLLIEKYGDPYNEKKEVYSTLYDVNDWDDFMLAVVLGEGRMRSVWNLDDGTTGIVLGLSGGDGLKKNLGILYTNVDMQLEENENKEKSE